MCSKIGIHPQCHLRFDAYDSDKAIRVQRVDPFGGAQFVVYGTDDKVTLGGGSCPALSAHPPYVTVNIPARTPFTVQNVSPNVAIEVTY